MIYRNQMWWSVLCQPGTAVKLFYRCDWRPLPWGRPDQFPWLHHLEICMLGFRGQGSSWGHWPAVTSFITLWTSAHTASSTSALLPHSPPSDLGHQDCRLLYDHIEQCLWGLTTKNKAQLHEMLLPKLQDTLEILVRPPVPTPSWDSSVPSACSLSV